MILGHNHHVIVPDTRDEVARVAKVYTSTEEDLAIDIIRIDLFGDDLMFGRDPDQEPPIPGVGSLNDFTARIPTPPHELIKVFLPQFQLEINNRAVGNTASGNLLNGSDGVNSAWPDNINANIIVINHGLHDAKANVDIETYKNNLIALRQGVNSGQILVWQTPAPALTVNTAPYADAMIQVANQFNDLVADTRKILNWTNELPDGEYPRQLGYARWIDLVLSEKINSAILKHLGPKKHKFYRLDRQEKFILDNENTITLSFTPISASWVEIYHRNNDAYYAVSRGNVDIATNPVNNISGHLAGGLHKIDTGEQLVSVTKGYTLIKIRRDDGKVIYSKTFDVATDVRHAQALATALNETSSDYIVVVTTYDEPQSNRLTFELLDAMYRCGASTEIFGNAEFRKSSAYILIGIPGVGKGGGMEAYAGLTDDDRYAYCEIEFEIASNGVPYARDIFPPVAKIQRSWDLIVPLINPIYDLIAGVPPINGDRILNPRYATFFTPGVANETFVIQGNTIIFNEAITGVVTVVCDTQIELSKAGVVINIDNIHNYDTYVQRFNPARWAPGKETTTYPLPDPTNPLAPPQVVGASGVNALGLHNTYLAQRIGSALYCDPIVIHQPNFGYVRITADRKKMIYYPFPNFVGMDSFSYTLLTQHGQAGPTKSVYVDVAERLTPAYTLTANKTSVDEGSTVEITLTTTLTDDGTQVPYIITGVTLGDFAGQQLAGVFTVFNNTAKITLTPRKDMVTEGPEFLTLTLVGVYPTKKITVTVNDTSPTPTITLTPNISIANEGDVVRFTATADIIIDGTPYLYTVTGINSDDVVEPLSGSITFVSNTAYTDFTIIKDVKTEGSETLTMTLLGTVPLVSNSVFITDTSLDPTYKLFSNVNVVEEGKSVKFYVQTTEVQNGVVIPYNITGIDPLDVYGSLQRTFTVNNHYAESVIVVRADRATEGPEVMVATLEGILQSDANVITTSVLITDTSLDPTYKLFSNVNVVEEGDSIKFYVQTTDVNNGEVIPYNITGVSSADITGSLIGSFVVNNGYSEIVIATRKDRTTEGTETLSMTLTGVPETSANIISADVTISDTSPAPILFLTSNVTTISEGESVKFTLSTSNMFDGERVYYTIFDIDSSDILQPLDGGSFLINNNTSEVVITARADRTTEGDETFRFVLDNIVPTGNITSVSVTILDTSLDPTYRVEANVTTANEGDSIRFTLTTTDVSDGQQVFYQLNNVTDLLGTVSTTGSFIVQSNTAVSPVYTLKEDLKTEGTETFTLTLLNIRNTVSNVTIASVTVIDTSTSPIMSISADKTSINEGETVVFTLNVLTNDVPDGTQVTYMLEGVNGLNLQTDIVGSFSSSTVVYKTFTVYNNQANVSYTAVADRRTESTEALRLTVQPSFVVEWADNINSREVSIIDTSLTPVLSINFNPSTIIEGQATVATITSTGLLPGETLNYSITGAGLAGVFATPTSGTLTPDATGTATLGIVTQPVSFYYKENRFPTLTVTGPSSSSKSASFTLLDTLVCGSSVDDSGARTYRVDFGTGIGVIGINYDAYSAADSFSITWNGITRSVSLRTNTGTLRINKTSAYPTTGTITVTPGPSGGSASVTVYCALS